MLQTVGVFLLAALAEIAGGYFVWQWLREGQAALFGLIGGIILIAYGIIMTWQTFPTFGRVYAAYGGVFILLSILWGWAIDKKTPDFYDWIGVIICLFGATIILFAPRQS